MSRLIHMLKWLLAGVLVWTLGWVGMVYRHSGPGLGPSAVMAVEESTPTQAAAEPSLIQAPEVDYALLRNHDPFGGSGAAGAQAGHPGVQAAGDALGVVLVGTVSARAPVARAVLQDVKTKATTVCRIGDRVGEAILESVSRDAAVFAVQGRRLVLKRVEIGSRGVGADPEPRAPEPRRPAVPQAAQAPQSAQPESGDVVQQFLDKVTVTPVQTDDGQEGLRLTGLDEIPGAHQLGLEDGDVIRAVNGQPLADPRKAFQILKKARSQESIRVDLVRKGQNKTLSFNLR